MGRSPAAQTAAAAQTDGLPVPRRYWAIAAIILAITMSVLDSTIVNVALPSLAHDFRASDAASIWVINAYQIAILIALLPLASSERSSAIAGSRNAALAVFTIASLACALAPTLTTLSIARVAQGLGAAGIMSVNSALVRFTYPQRMLGRAIGINAFCGGDRRRDRSDHRLGHTGRRSLALAVRGECAHRPRHHCHCLVRASRNTALLTAAEPPRLWVLQIGTFALLIGGLQSFAHDADDTARSRGNRWRLYAGDRARAPRTRS